MERKEEIVRGILDVLRPMNVRVLFDAHTLDGLRCTQGLSPISSVADLDVLLVVGGDGTILRSIRELRPGTVPVIAVNAGSVGFLSEMPLADIATHVRPLLFGDGMIERRTCVDADVIRDGSTVFSCSALNDVAVAQGAISRLLDLKASIGGHFLATFHADGLIVSTPTGSTAYSLAAGGPVVHPAVDALILTPINPHSFTQKPIVIPGDAPIEVVIADSGSPGFDNATVGITIDGQVYHELRAGDRVVVRTGAAVHFVRSSSDAFYRALRTKLKWGEGIEG
jgi:NAD+ kinase